MRYKKYLNSLVISIFAVSAIMFGSFHNDVSAGFWDWFGVGNDSQPAVVNNMETTYKWVNNGLVSESSGKYTGNCAKKQVTTYTCRSSNVGNKLYDGTNRGASYGDVGHAWPVYAGENTSTATEYTWSGCGLDKRTGGQVNEWECKTSGVTGNSSSSISSSLNSVPKIISPNGGENWVIGTNQNILFSSAGAGGRKAKILLVDKNDAGANTWSVSDYTIADITLGNEGEGTFSWIWKVGDAKRIDDGATSVSGSYKIKICVFPDSGSDSSNTMCDNSDALFNTVSGGSSSSLSSSSSSSKPFVPFVRIISPNGGEIWTQGTTYEIKYQTNVGHSLKIAIVKGLYEKKYVMSIGDTASYSDINTYKWSVPYGTTPGNDYFIRIGSEIGSVGYEFSDSPFTISSNTSSSRSSTSSSVSAITGGVDYDSAHATAYLNGTIYNPNKENVFYHFKYGKEKEPSSSAKQTVWATINSGSSANVTALTSSLSSGIKYVYRLYVYSNTTGSTVSGELKSFTTLSSSSSSISSLSSNSASYSQGFSLSQLVELLISLGVISPDKADLARTAVKSMSDR